MWVLPVRQSSEVPFMFDSSWDSAWPKETELPPGSLYDPAGGPPMNISNNWSRLCVARHNMAINIGYMDGHAASVALPDLWRQKWHKEWDVSLVNFDTVNTQIRSRYKG
jgi:prepilin-type processing-associated H-X9-DG protein